ncbi:hypothetical protein BDY19DRAFT_966527 [Irpex rosettiformis]|uniref:Uncharacterized protein n=1 Tax=Irpex rosettiformis TaxID=378272 RepID=A0ACB8TTE7_9APHY|nr:hypothetical protein BDY19DRAFT_966527 [Irpex rosettiformis]
MQTTTGNRRDSLLELFDPLVNTTPHTPPRSSSTGSKSPDSSVGSSSDKENDNPTPSRCGPVTEYFMRVYKDPKHTQLTEPQSPSGRLIDLSMTVEDEDSENRASGEDGERMEGVEDFGGCLGPDDSAAEYLQEMRMPLAELQLEKLSLPAEQPEAAMDIDPESTHHDDNATQPRSSQPGHSQPLRSVITAPAPFGTPLADIINSINYGSSPSISICPPDDDIVFEPEYESPLPRNSNPSTSDDSHLSPDSSLTSFRTAGTLRRTITSSANDPRRISCDLQSSFSLVF